MRTNRFMIAVGVTALLAATTPAWAQVVNLGGILGTDSSQPASITSNGSNTNGVVDLGGANETNATGNANDGTSGSDPNADATVNLLGLGNNTGNDADGSANVGSTNGGGSDAVAHLFGGGSDGTGDGATGTASLGGVTGGGGSNGADVDLFGNGGGGSTVDGGANGIGDASSGGTLANGSSSGNNGAATTTLFGGDGSQGVNTRVASNSKAKGACFTPNAQQIDFLLSRSSHSVQAAMIKPTKVSFIPVVLCVDAKAQLADASKLRKLQTTVSNNATLTAQLNSAGYDDSDVIAVENKGSKLTVYTY